MDNEKEEGDGCWEGPARADLVGRGLGLGMCGLPEQTWLAQKGIGLTHLYSPHSLTPQTGASESFQAHPLSLLQSQGRSFHFGSLARNGVGFFLPPARPGEPSLSLLPASWHRAPVPCYHGRCAVCHLLLQNLLKFSESSRRLSCSTTVRLQGPRAGTTKQPQCVGDFCAQEGPLLSLPH